MKIVQEAFYSLLSILWLNALQIAVVGTLWVLNVAIKEWLGIDCIQIVRRREK